MHRGINKSITNKNGHAYTGNSFTGPTIKYYQQLKHLSMAANCCKIRTYKCSNIQEQQMTSVNDNTPQLLLPWDENYSNVTYTSKYAG